MVTIFKKKNWTIADRLWLTHMFGSYQVARGHNNTFSQIHLILSKIYIICVFSSSNFMSHIANVTILCFMSHIANVTIL
jgi:hypothetical protein